MSLFFLNALSKDIFRLADNNSYNGTKYSGMDFHNFCDNDLN